MIPEFTVAWAKHVDMPIVLVDVDGVLFDHRHRLPLITNPDATAADRAEYNNRARYDPPMQFLAAIDDMALGWMKIVFLSARPNTAEQLRIFRDAMRQSLSTEVFDGTRLALHFKNVNDYGHGTEASTQFKRDFVTMLQREHIRILFAVDDSDHQLAMYRSLGVCALKVMP